MFSLSELDLGEATTVQHRIKTIDCTPARQPLRRQPMLYAETVDKHIDEMLKASIIEPAQSEWASNLVLTKKKDGTTRCCVDYRQLNERTIKDSYALPRIDECLDTLKGAVWFSTLDLRSGYHQVAMHPGDADKTAFVTRRGMFRFRRMPFGLCNAGATFQRLMDVALAGLNYECCLVYLDDIMVFATDAETHLSRLRKVFEKLQAVNLKLKPSKCSLLQKEVSFLGYIVSPAGISADQSKIESVKNWPTPNKLREVRGFDGLCSYYHKFIQGFSDIAAPLHDLTKKNQPFVWSQKCQAAFDELKQRLCTAPVLSLPANEGTYILDCDASDHGIGAALHQIQDGEEKVLAYGSRLYGKCEKNYCVTRKELLAVVFFTKVFKQYLLGREFVLRTDHAALQWLQRTPEPIGQQGRWLEKLQEFQYRIIHRAGRKHTNADSLSRKPCRQCDLCNSTTSAVTENKVKNPWSPSKLQEAQKQDPDLQFIYKTVENNVRPDWAEILGQSSTIKTYWHMWDDLHIRYGVLYRKTRSGIFLVIVPQKMKKDFFKIVHEDITNGHLGVKRTRLQTKRRAYWVGWSKDVERLCKECNQCARYHRGLPPKLGPLQPIPTGETWERLSIDITGPHPRSVTGKMYILTMMDQFSKFVEAVAIPNQEAKTVAKALVDNVIVRYGTPLQILSDRGTNFESTLFHELCIILKIDKIRTTSYHPSTNGMLERFDRTLNSMLARVVSDNQKDWCLHLPKVMAAYRATVHEATGFSPNFLVFAHENRAPMDLVFGRPLEDSEHRPTYSEYVETMADTMESSYRTVREHLGKAAEIRKKRYDMKVRPSQFAIGTFVWYYTPRKYVGKSAKWQKFYTGPFLVIDVLPPVNYVLQKTKRSKSFVAHVDKLKICHDDTLVSWTTEITATTPTSDGEIEEVNPDLPTGDLEVQESVRPKRKKQLPRRYDC